MKLFLDSSAFIARAVEDDRFHEEALGTFSGIASGELPYRRFYTSNYVVDETVTFVLYEAGPRAAVETLEVLRSSPTLRILHVGPDTEAAADGLFRRYASSRISYTDCTTKVVMERETIPTAFSFDRDLRTLGLHVIP